MTQNLPYFDNNSTTAVDEEVIGYMLQFFNQNYGNAGSTNHPYGLFASVAVDLAKHQICRLINCEPEELVFTSGATESVNTALKGIYRAYASKGNHIITCKTEHKAVLDCCTYLEENGAEITYLKVDPEGLIDLDELKKTITDRTILVCLMAANNETGVKHPLEKISEICHEKNIIFFSDATQLVGKERCDVQENGIDAMAFSAHKFHGPKGIGAMYLRRKDPRVNVAPLIHGGGQQNGKRAGTLNVPAIAAFGKAAEIAMDKYWENSAHISKLKNHFEHQLLEIPGLRINGSTRERLHNTSNICFPAEYNIKQLMKSFAFSAGSACTTELKEPSHVLEAMGLAKNDILNSFRFSFSKYNTLEEINTILDAIRNACS